MRFPLVALAALSVVSGAAACDLSTAPPGTQQVTVSGFVGKGFFSDSVPTGAAFQLIAPDSSGQNSGQLVMAGDVVPPAGTYNLDTNQFPQGFTQLSVDFIRPLSGGTSELYQPAAGSMVLTTVAGDSIGGTLHFTMGLAALCTGTSPAFACQQVSVSNKQLTLSGSFLVRRGAATTFTGR